MPAARSQQQTSATASLPGRITDASAAQIYATLAENQQKLKAVKAQQKTVSEQLAETEEGARLDLQAELFHLQGEEKILKLSIYRDTVLAHEQILIPETAEDGRVVYAVTTHNPLFNKVYRLSGFDDGQYQLSSGGKVVGSIPSGLPGFTVPLMDFGLISDLLATAFIIALIGFMEATSISRALAAKSREKLNPNQELIGQGLGNMVSGLFQGYAVSGSFSRSAVNINAGAVTGLSAVVTGLAVGATLLFLTTLLYHLPQATLAAVIMMAVINLVKIEPIIYAWRVQPHDGIVAIVTFILTLIVAPHLETGIVTGV